MLDAPLFGRFVLEPAPGAAVVDSSERRAERSWFASPSDVVAAEEDEREAVVRERGSGGKSARGVVTGEWGGGGSYEASRPSPALP